MLLRLVPGLLGILLLACTATEGPAESIPPHQEDDPKTISEPAPNPAPAVVDTPPVENHEHWHATLRTIASAYNAWGRVDDEYRFAPFLCRMPTGGRLEFSKSSDVETHGEKIYSLYAFDPVAYGAPATVNLPLPGLDEKKRPEPEVVQAIVKETFVPQHVEQPQHGLHDPAPASREGKLYGRGDPAGLYIMFKPKDTTAQTDAGWVYGTIAADGTITAAGQVKNCVGCHQKNPDRVFGLQRKLGYPPQPRGPNGEKVLNRG